jgi:hypothetical protein
LLAICVSILWALQEAWDPELGSKMRMNTRRYMSLLSDAVEACLPEPDAEPAERDVFDVLQEQRSQNNDPDQVCFVLVSLCCLARWGRSFPRNRLARHSELCQTWQA